MPALAPCLDRQPVGKLLELGWNHTPLKAPQRSVVREFADGRRMLLNLEDQTQRAMFCGAYEPAEGREVARRVANGGVFIDAGAHVGWFTLIAARSAGAKGKVIAVEAYPPNAAQLRHNVGLNGHSNVEIQAVALTDSLGTVTVGRQRNSDSGSATAGPGGEEGLYEVTGSTLDQVAEGLDAIDLLKVDVEGLETRVFGAGREALERTEAVLVEVNESALRRNGTSREELLECLRAAGLDRVQSLDGLSGPLRRRFTGAYEDLLVSRR